jgi:DNA-binding XRE family transcriptional regulator
MGCPEHLQIESRTIGELPRAVGTPDVAGHVVIGTFEVPSPRPLPGAIALDDFVKELESDSDMAFRLEKARRELAKTLPGINAFRKLRLEAGLSQAKLAERAGTTQTYIARIEADSVDPGTDMVGRLAAALNVEDVVVFCAVRSQRTHKEKSVG